jgi:DNA/RNA endonuclease YhcR with UshA esterase domain
MNRKLTNCCLATGVALLLAGTTLVAHHAETAQFDANKPVELTGVVKKVEWANPHIWFFVDVKDETGKVTTWGFSGLPPGMLARRGFTKSTMKPGDVITVRGSRAKDGSNNASGQRVTFADGRQVFPNALDVGIGAGAPAVPARP